LRAGHLAIPSDPAREAASYRLSFNRHARFTGVSMFQCLEQYLFEALNVFLSQNWKSLT